MSFARTNLLSYLNHLGVPEGAGEDGPEPLGGLVDGDAAQQRLVLHVAVGQARQPVRVQHLHRPVEQAVLWRRPALPKNMRSPYNDIDFVMQVLL